MVDRWLQIKTQWRYLQQTEQYMEVSWNDLESIFKTRFDRQTTELYWVTDVLRPDRIGPFTKLPPSVFDTVRGYLRKTLPEDVFQEAVKEFSHFRLRNGGSDALFSPDSVVYDDSFKPATAWYCLLSQGSILAGVAIRVFAILANSVPSERSFSAINFIHTKARNRLF